MRRWLLVLFGGVAAVASASAWWVHRQPTLFLRHSPSRLYQDYGGPLPSRVSSRSGDQIQDAQSRERIARLFDDFYVVKDGATDCSFVASLMLMLRADPDFPFRTLYETDNGYAVRFPGLPGVIQVTRDDLRAHRASWERTREHYRKIWRGHLPEGLEILRRAYYNYQAALGIRGQRGMVYGGGLPAEDLIALSGAKASYRLQPRCPDDAEPFNDSCGLVQIETRIGEGGKFSSTILGTVQGKDSPLGWSSAADRCLIVASSSAKPPRVAGASIVPYHAYYYLGSTADGRYVLGNAYQTRRPITITPADFRRCFRAIDFVVLSEIP